MREHAVLKLVGVKTHKCSSPFSHFLLFSTILKVTQKYSVGVSSSSENLVFILRTLPASKYQNKKKILYKKNCKFANLIRINILERNILSQNHVAAI